MPSFFSYSPKTTSISFPWPSQVTGLERIALSSQGDLQRVLSAFFARPIVVTLVYSHTFSHIAPDVSAAPLSLPNPSAVASASPATPIIQTRQVHLQCSGKIVCTATSTVRMTSPEIAHLFLEEKYAIGQMFTRLEKAPAFELLDVGLSLAEDGTPDKVSRALGGCRQRQQLWRKYKLVIPDFDCEILEVFPSREMFTNGESWLNDGGQRAKETLELSVKVIEATSGSRQLAVIFLLGLGLLMLGFEASKFVTGRPSSC